MEGSKIHKKLKTTALFIGTVGLILLISLINVSGQSDTQTFVINDYYESKEFSYTNGSLHIDEQFIEIPFPSDRWTVKGLELNISNLELEREIVTIEENGTDYDVVSAENGEEALGVEIVITEPTTLFGVEIYGALTETDPLLLPFVQIQGIDTNVPNGTIFAQTTLNMSRAVMWYEQIFTSAPVLQPGNYFLVINATHLSASDKSNYLWMYNDVDPSNPSLNTAVWARIIITQWWNTGTGRPYRHKLIQKVVREYNPEEINMTARINDVPYQFMNGSIEGSGFLNASDLNIEVTGSVFHIPIERNISALIQYDLNYTIYLENDLFSTAQLTIQEGENAQWSITPEFNRDPSLVNYSIELIYPHFWTNIEVLRDGFDVTGEVSINDTTHTITILNDTIQAGADWVIKANSALTEFDITTQQTTYEPNQLLQFSVNPPSQTGKLTFVFADSQGFVLHSDNISVSSENEFSYQIPPNPVEDTYYAYIFWNNQTHAGLYVQEYSISVPFNLTTLQLASIIAGSIMVPLIGIVTVSGVRKSNRKKEAMRQEIFNKYQDVLHLEHIIIADKKSGLDIYDESISGKGVQATLVTGFLEAIRSFGIELTNSDKESQTIKLEYQQSKILMSEFKNIRTTLIMTDNPSQDFVDSVKNLSEEIEEKYREHLVNFKGNTTAFQNLNFFIAKHLKTSLIYPLKLNETRKTSMTSVQKSVIQKVKGIMKQNNTDYFYVSQLFTEKKGFQTGWGVSILKLIDKGVFSQKQ